MARAIEYIRRICSLCRQIYAYAKVVKQTIKYNPIDDIKDYLQQHEPKNMRHVQQHEIPKLLQAIQNYPTELGRYALMLLALNYCRPSELIKAQWHEIDLEFGLWTLESERMKKKKAFIRPLARQSIHILQQLKRITGDSPYLFPSRLDRNKPMTIGFLQMALNRLKVNQTPHGFRHIANTYLTENASKHKIHYEVIEFSLAHAVKGIRGVYNKAQYLDDRKILAQWYADQLYSMIE